SAKKSVHMTMYMLTSTDVINALLARKKAGVDVRVVLNQTFPQGGSNQTAYTQLQQGGVAVHWAPASFTLTHEKCFIVDGQSAWIMTMNAGSSTPDTNREYLAIDTDPSDVAEAETIFLGDYAGTPPASVSGALVVAPLNASASLLTLLQSAVSTLDLEVEELSDYRVADALKAVLGRGVKVRVVLPDNALTAAGQQAVATVKAAGGKLVEVHTPYIHAKAIVVDGKVAFVGSENLTLASVKYNRELGVVFDTASEVKKVSTTIAADFATGVAL
ncbi:MAG TPA: phospholipase D-like domain-containing protein, partial [Polyangiaceae bacterium]